MANAREKRPLGPAEGNVLVEVRVRGDPEAARRLTLEALSPSQLLVLGGKAIGEPIAQHGPFVMNSADEIRAAFVDYQRTQFGGWPWPSEAPVHPRAKGRFALHADGRLEEMSSRTSTS